MSRSPTKRRLTGIHRWIIPLLLLAPFVSVQQAFAEDPIAPMPEGWKKALVDCRDNSTWEVTLLPYESGVWIYMKNCFCAMSVTNAKKGFAFEGQQWMPLIADTLKKGELWDSKKMIERYKAARAEDYERVDDQSAFELALASGEQEKSVNLYCYTLGQIELYMEQLKKVVEEAM
jgi:hypothetical protein